MSIEHESPSSADRAPTPERLELEARLESATQRFGQRAERLLAREVTDRESAEAALDVIESWVGRIAAVEENPVLNGLDDAELFNRTYNPRRSVPSVAAIRQWMIREDNFERLMEFHETLDRERFNLPDRPST